MTDQTPEFITVGEGDNARKIAVRHREGAAPIVQT